MLSTVFAKIQNPALGNLGSMNSTEFFGNLISTIISLMLVIGGILLLISILRGGIEWVTSGGDKIKTESARKTLTNAVIGITILFSFFAIINLIGCVFGINFFEIQVGEFNVSFGNNPFCGTSNSVEPPPDPPLCFAEGTKISMADGSLKNIEDIRKGDLVYSYDTTTSKIVTSTVVLTTTHPESRTLIINKKINVTENHRFYLPRTDEWKNAKDLTIGDNLLSINGNSFEISAIEKNKDVSPVYNFEVDSYHNYFADDILVHNKV